MSRKPLSPSRARNAVGAPGVGVDAQGGGVIDPTQNVLQLVEAAVERLNDLREADTRWLDLLRISNSHRLDDLRAAESRRVDEQSNLRAEYAEKLQRAESGRLDSIRAVDREDVAKTAAAAQTAIGTLATQTITLKDTLATQVANTAAAAEARLATFSSDVMKRLSQLELSSSASAGKQMVSDPATAELVQSVKELARLQAQGVGRATATDPAIAQMAAAVQRLVERDAAGAGRATVVDPAMAQMAAAVQKLVEAKPNYTVIAVMALGGIALAGAVIYGMLKP